MGLDIYIKGLEHKDAYHSGYIGFMNFAKKCKELRIKKVATQEQMAIALNLYSQAVSKWKNRD